MQNRETGNDEDYESSAVNLMTELNLNNSKSNANEDEDSAQVTSIDKLHESLESVKNNLDGAKTFVSAARGYIDSLINVVGHLQDVLALAEVDVKTAEECIAETSRRVAVLKSKEIYAKVLPEPNRYHYGSGIVVWKDLLRLLLHKDVNAKPKFTVTGLDMDSDPSRIATIKRLNRSLDKDISTHVLDTVKKYVNRSEITLDDYETLQYEQYDGLTVIVVGPKVLTPTSPNSGSVELVYGSNESLDIVNHTLDCDLEFLNDQFDDSSSACNHKSKLEDYTADDRMHAVSYQKPNVSMDPERGNLVYDSEKFDEDNLDVVRPKILLNGRNIENVSQNQTLDNNLYCYEVMNNTQDDSSDISSVTESSNAIFLQNPKIKAGSISTPIMSEGNKVNDVNQKRKNIRKFVKSKTVLKVSGRNNNSKHTKYDDRNNTNEISSDYSDDSTEDVKFMRKTCFQKNICLFEKAARITDKKLNGDNSKIASASKDEFSHFSTNETSTKSKKKEIINKIDTQYLKPMSKLYPDDDDDDSYTTISEATTSDTSVHDEESYILNIDTSSNEKNTGSSYSEESLEVSKNEDANISLTDCSSSDSNESKTEYSCLFRDPSKDEDHSYGCHTNLSRYKYEDTQVILSATNGNSDFPRLTQDALSYVSLGNEVSSSCDDSGESIDENRDLLASFKEQSTICDDERDIDESCLVEESTFVNAERLNSTEIGEI